MGAAIRRDSTWYTDQFQVPSAAHPIRDMGVARAMTASYGTPLLSLTYDNPGPTHQAAAAVCTLRLKLDGALPCQFVSKTPIYLSPLIAGRARVLNVKGRVMERTQIYPFLQGLSFLHKRFDTTSGVQSFISTTPDMQNPVVSPETLFGGLTTFPTELFTSMVVVDLLYKDFIASAAADEYLDGLSKCHRDGLFHFFLDTKLLPADVDCTAVGLSLLHQTDRAGRNLVNRAVDRMMQNTDEAGVIKVYFPPCGHRQYVDPVVCLNALYLFALVGREAEARATLDFVRRWALSGEYIEGTRYYPSPDVFLYFLFRFVDRFPSAAESLAGPLRRGLRERFDTSRSPLDLAIRVMLARKMGIANDGDHRRLTDSQARDGAWAAGPFFRFGKRRGFFGSRELTTAFAIKALAVRTEPAPVMSGANSHRRDQSAEATLLPFPNSPNALAASAPKFPLRKAG